MADESVFSPADALRITGQHFADLISIKIMKSGGMLRAREIAGVAEAGGLACYGGSMFETGIASTAGAHLIAATPNISLGCEFYQPNYYLAEDVLAHPFAMKDGKVQVPSGPGLGIMVDEDKVQRYAVR
jgi:muconate cycloisomerase